MKTALRMLCALVLVALVGGCRLFNEDAIVQGHSPLRPMMASPESVALEIIWARFPTGDVELNDTMWSQIDESQLTPGVRRELANNGFRGGVIAGTPPDVIARTISRDAYHQQHADESADPFAERVDLAAEPTVQRRFLQLRGGKRAEIQASDVLESMPLLISRGREMGGRTYQDAQAVYALRVEPRPDQFVDVELMPELHFGSPRLRFTGGDENILRQMPLRDREVFDTMRLNVRLAPGEMLVLASLPESTSRLGHYFHTVDSSEGPRQKIILIRLAQVPTSDTFAGLTER